MFNRHILGFYGMMFTMAFVARLGWETAEKIYNALLSKLNVKNSRWYILNK